VDGKLYFAYGTWIPNNEHKHSNNKELRNLVNSVIKVYEAGILACLRREVGTKRFKTRN
jgi:hypothetical protein